MKYLTYNLKEYYKLYYKNNVEKLKQKSNTYYHNNIHKAREYYIQNKEIILAKRQTNKKKYKQRANKVNNFNVVGKCRLKQQIIERQLKINQEKADRFRNELTNV